MGLPDPAQIVGKLEQLKQVVCGTELDAAPLQTHQQIGGVFRAARQLTPLVVARPVDIHGQAGAGATGGATGAAGGLVGN